MSSRTAKPKAPGEFLRLLLTSQTILECSNHAKRLCGMRFTLSRPSDNGPCRQRAAFPPQLVSIRFFPQARDPCGSVLAFQC